MSHRVAMYQVRVRPKGATNDWRTFSDFDGTGEWLGDVLYKALGAFEGTSADDQVRARFHAFLPELEQDQVGAALVSGRSGVVSHIEKDGDDVPFRRTRDHHEKMRSAVLFDLPRGASVGSMLVHVPHRQSCKSIVDVALTRAVSDLGFKMDVSPVVSQHALLEAIRVNGVEHVTLIKRDPLSSDSFRDASQWGQQEVSKLELKVASARGLRLQGQSILRFLDDPTDEARRRLIVFEGLPFDDLAVTVDLLDGGRRTFTLERPEGGHPLKMSIDISPDDSDSLGATADALSRELRGALKSVTPDP